ncbi:hypothetical protein NX059_011445 [Plenodomus lindquistii]|nr:hypothetical protein NX059_011445 [Plenodomus lindquistii]
MAPATSDPAMHVELDFLFLKTNINALRHHISLLQNLLEEWIPLQYPKVTETYADDTSLGMSKEVTFPGVTVTPLVPSLSAPREPRVAEFTMITADDAPLNHLDNIWWKFLLLMIIDFLALRIFSKAVAYPLESLVVTIFVVHMNQNAEGGLVAELWRGDGGYGGKVEDEQGQQLGIEDDKHGTNDGRVSPTDSGIGVEGLEEV